MKYSKCPVCGSDKLQSFLKVNGYRVSEDQFNIDECTNCSFKFTNPLPNEDEIGRYYESDNYISHTSSKKGIFDIVYQLIRKRAIRSKYQIVRPYIASNGTLLDYGCGTGHFLDYANGKGTPVKGFEPSEIAISNSPERIREKIKAPNKLNELEDNCIGAFTMWHVFEHVYDIYTLLEQAKRVLREEGILVIAVPNHESLDAEIHREYWAAWDVPIHHSHFNKSSMKLTLDNAGFDLVDIKEMPFDSFYISLLSNELEYGKKKPVKAFFTGLKSNLVGYKNKNTSSLIYLAQPRA